VPSALAIPRLIVSGAASGSGKTTVTLGLAAALRARGLSVAVLKCGPDYLDPTWLARAAGRTCHNLDGWMMGREALLSTFARAAVGCDVALVEGMMGLFDGAAPQPGGEGSTAEIARWLAAPVLLCVDASGMAGSVAAVARGFATLDPALHVAGLVCNRLGGEAHLDLLRAAVTGPPRVVGGLPDERAMALPERHLGLRRAGEDALPPDALRAWAARVERWIDVDRVLALARAAPPLEASLAPALAPVGACRLGVARDEAFHFYYEDNLAQLAALGAELVPFSPVHDRRLPEVDGLLVGGGYPEEEAATLAANAALRGEVAAFARSGRPVYAECGGLMYLCASIRTRDGGLHPMVGLLDATAVMHDRPRALGYVEVETTAPTLLGPAGARFRGHEFRYSELEPGERAPELVYALRGRPGSPPRREGYRAGAALASYVHGHWGRTPEVPAALVAACVARRRGG
jgi:cobyrinic acid a,c-diamide synthase